MTHPNVNGRMSKQRFTAGIHNYCDRWCERCAFTDRCRVYSDLAKADRRHKRSGEDPHDPAVALRDVHRSFQRTMRLIARGVKRMGIDLDEIARQAAEAPFPDRSRIDEHPLVREGMSFFEIGREFVKAVGEQIGLAGEDIARRSAFMDVKGEAEELARVADAVEVLNWDSSLVAVKVHRAVSGLLGDDDDEAAGDDGAAGDYGAAGDDEAQPDPFHLQDATATAALVLSCLDRDKRALLAIYDWSRDHQDAAVELLAKAERIGRAIRQVLPGK